MNTVDALGRSCPEPVLLTRRALSASPDALCVLVDNPAAKENVTRLAMSMGYRVDVAQKDNVYTLELTR